jgi:hypothetical protein
MSNEEVLLCANRHRQLLEIIKQWKTSYLGYILRGLKYILLKAILNEKRKENQGVGNIHDSAKLRTGIPDVVILFRRARESDSHYANI